MKSKKDFTGHGKFAAPCAHPALPASTQPASGPALSVTKLRTQEAGLGAFITPRPWLTGLLGKSIFYKQQFPTLTPSPATENDGHI